MSQAPPRTPRQPKLRASCDSCGAAKLKCSRDWPQCERCFSLGLGCVYGVSRKMGKPPREKPRISEASSASRTPSKQAGSIDRDIATDNSCSSGPSGAVGDTIFPSSEPYRSVDNVTSAWRAVEGYTNSLMTSIDEPDGSHSDLLDPSFDDLMSLHFGENILSKLAAPGLDCDSDPKTQAEASQSKFDEKMCFDGTLELPSGGKGHDCSREAHEILESLCFPRLDKANFIAQPTPGSSSASASPADRVPLDHILCLNREASERLGHLLTCACAKSPYLALLYASIFSRILIWYQQAAGCTPGASWDPAAMILDTASPQVSLTESLPSLSSTSGVGSSAWSSTAASTFGTGGAANTPTLTQSTVFGVTPTTMALGTFSVDDLRVQTALKIQLVSGEMRRAGHLIDQFASHISGGQSLADGYICSGVNSLYQSLNSWFRGEHSRITNIIKSNLRDLNT